MFPTIRRRILLGLYNKKMFLPNISVRALPTSPSEFIFYRLLVRLKEQRSIPRGDSGPILLHDANSVLILRSQQDVLELEPRRNEIRNDGLEILLAAVHLRKKIARPPILQKPVEAIKKCFLREGVVSEKIVESSVVRRFPATPDVQGFDSMGYGSQFFQQVLDLEGCRWL